MKADILIAHPGKHHALHLVAGCIKSGVSVCYATPFYRRGLGRLIASLPGSIGDKASGYFHPDIPLHFVASSTWWQLKKLFSLYKKDESYESEFDRFVAHAIKTKKYQAKVLVTLQDYMPETVRAAKDLGWLIWSDQISNQSEAVSSRVLRHEKNLGLTSAWRHSEINNDEMIAVADVITAPSNYCFEGIKERINPHTQIYIIPYGANAAQFSGKQLKNPQEIVILARAQSFRKGGHLLLDALQRCGSLLLAASTPKKIKIVVLGNLEPVLCEKLKTIVLPDGLTVEHGNIPHAVVEKLYKKSSLFVMPSLSESMSLACIEALHAGLPLIITEYCGIDGFVSGEMGYLVEDTIESLGDTLVNAINQQNKWPEWGENSRQLAKNFTWNTYELEISNLIKLIKL